ncbi:MAG: transketolase [Planctomycetota bacterium]|nr:transketolase [Planctomycetota bacterium]
MRNAFANELLKLAETDDRIVLLSGDIGNRMFDSFKDRFPNRFFNCGVAEANMMSVAAGMAMNGLRPVVYTIVPFVTTRCLEQIRVDVCYHQAPVTIVGVGGGLSYASLGATHHSCEDIAFLRVLPEMTVICPGDAVEVRGALAAALRQDGPAYLRIGKKGEPVIHDPDTPFEIGKAITVRQGEEVALIVTGNMLPVALVAAELIARQDITVEVISMHTVKPLDLGCLTRVFAERRLVATIEEHSVLGGLGGAVAEWMTDKPDPLARLKRIGTSDRFLHKVGNQAFARQAFGIDAESIANTILESL